MKRLVAQIQALIGELRRRQVIRVAVVYGTTGFVILQLAEILIDPFGLGPWALRLITLVLILGFPLAIGLAWVYNFTDEGVVHAEEEQALEPGSGGSSVTSNGLIVGLLIVAIGLLLYPRLFSSGQETAEQVSTASADTAQIGERSIAVLPFEPLSSGEKSETFARGVHDDLLTRLSNISDLEVVSRTSVEKYGNTDLSLPAIADSLGVRWVMEGGVLESGGQIEVNAQLIDPENDAHVWADDYRRKLTAENLFAIQEEITDEIADALKAELTAGEEKRIGESPTDNLRAYRLYVKGRTLLNSRTKEGIRSAIDYFRSAIQEDSTYALAWSGLSDARGLFSGYGLDSLHVSVPTQEEAARRALKLNPDLAEAHTSMGQLHTERQNAPAALRELKRAIQLKPSYAQAHHWISIIQLVTGRSESALRHIELAADLSPHHPGIFGILAYAHLANGAPEAALMAVRRIPDSIAAGQATEAEILFHLGRWTKARKVVKAIRHDTGVQYNVNLVRTLPTLIDVATGQPARAQQRRAQTDEPWSPFFEALLHSALGNWDAAFATLRMLDSWTKWRVIGLRYFYPDILGPLRKDPRYDVLIREINQQWGLNPDGSIPEEIHTSTLPQDDV